MFVKAKQELFPSVSTSILTIRHPFCTPVVAKSMDKYTTSGVPEGRNSSEKAGAGILEWFGVWREFLTEQLPNTPGDVWVVR